MKAKRLNRQAAGNIALALCLVISFAGCNGGETPTPPQPGSAEDFQRLQDAYDYAVSVMEEVILADSAADVEEGLFWVDANDPELAALYNGMNTLLGFIEAALSAKTATKATIDIYIETLEDAYDQFMEFVTEGRIGQGAKPPAIADPYDIAGLQALVDAANDLLDETVEAESANEVPAGVFWAQQAAIDAFQEAVDYAQTALDNDKYGGPIDREVTKALAVLTAAKAAFEAARSEGALADDAVIAALEGLIADAEDLLDTTVTSANGADVPSGQYWVTGLLYTALEIAKGAAQNLLDNADPLFAGDVEAAAAVLQAALAAFEDARELGRL